MYEKIRKPKLLKDVPSPLLRSLPCLYYYSRYADLTPPEKIFKMYRSNVNYVTKALQILGQAAGLKYFNELARQSAELLSLAPELLMPYLEKFTIDFANNCTQYRDQLRTAMTDFRPMLKEEYNHQVNKLNILIIDTNNEPERVDRLKNTLLNYCSYQAEATSPLAAEHAIKQIQTDFVILSSTLPARVHQQVQSLKDFDKPGLAVVHFEKDKPVDKQALRHGAQLLKIGFPVLFKIFTPVRLYTTIDKTYMRHHLYTTKIKSEIEEHHLY